MVEKLLRENSLRVTTDMKELMSNDDILSFFQNHQQLHNLQIYV